MWRVCIITIIKLSAFGLFAEAMPIQFGIPASKIVQEIPDKDKDFAFIVPGDYRTYVFDDEESYYQDYRRSYFGITCKKGGWDCLRHYEILASGCIPYFTDIHQCDEKNLSMLPKELIWEAMHLPGVCFETKTIDHTKFDQARYQEILIKLMDYTKLHFTTQKMAQYILDKCHYHGSGEVLFLSTEIKPDYLRCLMLIGLKQELGARVIDVPKIPHIYKSYEGDIRELYGKGISYTKIVDDEEVDRNHIEQKIRDNRYDLIIYSSVHRGMPFYDLVSQRYPPEKIVYLCGEDAHECRFKGLNNFFLREW